MSLYVLPAKLLFSKSSSIVYFSVLHIPFQHKKMECNKKNAVLRIFVHLTQIKKTKSIKKRKKRQPNGKT